jgi:hypothetical protein
MMIKGYFVLGSTGNPVPLNLHPLSPLSLAGNHTKSNTRGHWEIFTQKAPQTVNIPTRDKQVLWWSHPEDNRFAPLISVLDSEPGLNYRSKLLGLQEKLSSPFLGVINNVSTSTHGSLALIGDFTYFGLHDTASGTSYLVWTDDDEDLQKIQQQTLLRYLVFRFPKFPVAFLPGEILCGKWWRWQKSGLLQAFNALELRLNNGSAGSAG